MEIPQALQNLGLSIKESLVYMALLKLGRASAAGVAGEAGLKRPTVYVILGELMQKGLVLKLPRARKQLFAAKPPEEFFAEARERLELAENALPALMALADKPQEKFRTLYFEGERGVKKVLADFNKRMAGKEILGFYARETEELSPEMREFFHAWNEDAKQRGTTLRGITPNDPSLEWYKERGEYFGAKMKYIDPQEYLSDCSIEVGADFVQIFSLRHLQVVWLENPDIASTMRQIFEMVWKSRKEPVVGKTEIAGT